jgi:hypothetical protein
MKYNKASIMPKNKVDVQIILSETPDWYNVYSQEKYSTYWGSGHTWYEESTDKRVDSWKSNDLYEIWCEEINGKAEKK